MAQPAQAMGDPAQWNLSKSGVLRMKLFERIITWCQFWMHSTFIYLVSKIVEWTKGWTIHSLEGVRREVCESIVWTTTGWKSYIPLYFFIADSSACIWLKTEIPNAMNQVSPYVVAAITFAIIYSAIDLLWAVIMNRKVDFPLFQVYLDRPVIPSERWEGWGFKGVRRSGQPDQREATEGAQEAREAAAPGGQAAALGFHGTISSWWASLRGNRQTSEQPQPTRQEREEEARRQFAEAEARRQAEEEAEQAERRDRPQGEALTRPVATPDTETAIRVNFD